MLLCYYVFPSFLPSSPTPMSNGIVSRYRRGFAMVSQWYRTISQPYRSHIAVIMVIISPISQPYRNRIAAVSQPYRSQIPLSLAGYCRRITRVSQAFRRITRDSQLVPWTRSSCRLFFGQKIIEKDQNTPEWWWCECSPPTRPWCNIMI